MDLQQVGLIGVVVAMLVYVFIGELRKRRQAMREAAERRPPEAVERRIRDEQRKREALAQQQREAEIAALETAKVGEHIVHSKEGAYLLLRDLFKHPKTELLAAAAAALDRLTPLPESERRKLKVIGCRIMNREDALASIFEGDCYEDRIEWVRCDSGDAYNDRSYVDYYEHCVYKMDEQTFAMTVCPASSEDHYFYLHRRFSETPKPLLPIPSVEWTYDKDPRPPWERPKG
jgi:hypothetical protein